MLRLLWCVLLALTACQPSMMPPGEEGPDRWVGRVEGTDALIAVALEEQSVVVYVCGKDSWETRTGWFASTLAEDAVGAEGPIQPATSGSGHALEATVITRKRVTGTIVFADGARHAFTAERADPRTAAGLYDTTMSEGQAGLIITNDLDAAGAATSVSGTDVGVTRAPVQVSMPLSGVSSTAITGISVSIPNLSVTLLTPILPLQQSVTGSSPLLYILVHGMAHPVDAEVALVDTPFYSRGEWSMDFMRGLLGADPGAAVSLSTFVRSFTDAEFRDVGASFPATLGDSEIADNGSIPANFVTAFPVMFPPAGAPVIPRPPPAAAFITYRDATGGLAQSGQRIANQAYLALRWYELRFRRTPRVVFVTQSFGGLASRVVLSAPTTNEFTAAGVLTDGVTLTAEDRRRMFYVRDRTVSLVTMGTPHQGSFLSDLAVPLQTTLIEMLAVLRGAASNASLTQRYAEQLRVLRTIFPLLPAPNLPGAQFERDAIAALEDLQRRVNGRAFRDMVLATMARANRGPLHPNRARRGTSPILNATGQLIPIYAGGSRSPGGRAFTAPELSAFGRFAAESEPERRWIMMTMGADLAVRLARAEGFGSSTTPMLVPFDSRLDRRRRIAELGPFVRTRAGAVAGQLSPWVVENQAAQTGLDAAVSLALGPAKNLALPISLDKEGQFDLSGQLSVPALGFQCTDVRVNRVVLDFGRLLTTLVQTWSSLDEARRRAGDVDLNGLAAALGLAASNLDDVKSWFLEKYRALNVADGRCQLPTDVSIASLFDMPNLVNWRLVDGTDSFPAPRWVRSDVDASDDEIDSDGAVAFDSAVGLTLGTTTPEFFDHARTDDVRNGAPSLGSWYRFYDSPIEADCHGMQHQFIAGEWIADTFAPAGPVPQRTGLGRF